MGAEEVTVMVKKAKVNAYVYSCVTSEKQVKDEIIAYFKCSLHSIFKLSHWLLNPMAVFTIGFKS